MTFFLLYKRFVIQIESNIKAVCSRGLRISMSHTNVSTAQDQASNKILFVELVCRHFVDMFVIWSQCFQRWTTRGGVTVNCFFSFRLSFRYYRLLTYFIDYQFIFICSFYWECQPFRFLCVIANQRNWRFLSSPKTFSFSWRYLECFRFILFSFLCVLSWFFW